MKKVFLDDLPKTKYGASYRIDWNNSIGYEVDFIFDDITDKLKIKEFNSKTRKISLEYKENIYSLDIGNFKSCHLSYIVGIKSHQFKYNIGEIVKTKTGEIEIIETTRLPKKYGYEKSYKYKCLIDGNIDYIKASNLAKGGGCKVCCSRKVIKGVNDVATTNPELVKYFINIEDSFKYTYGGSKKIKMICPICGFKKKLSISTLHRQGFGCNQCSDGISYPNKFITNFLSQIDDIDFKPEQIFNWSENKRYDFYIPKINCIIEAHGGHHYDGGFSRANGHTLEEEQENDRLKEELAKENGIDYYIVIDCKKSELEFIKNNILQSKLSKLLSFEENNIDWIRCEEFSHNSLIKTICDLWSNGITNTEQISNITKLNRSTVIRSLNKGSKLGWCDYNPKEEMIQGLIRGGNKARLLTRKKVICINTNEIFNSLTDATQHYNLKNSSSICGCCKGNNKTAGKHPITGEPLKWMHYDDYIKLNENNSKIIHNINE